MSYIYYRSITVIQHVTVLVKSHNEFNAQSKCKTFEQLIYIWLKYRFDMFLLITQAFLISNVGNFETNLLTSMHVSTRRSVLMHQCKYYWCIYNYLNSFTEKSMHQESHEGRLFFSSSIVSYIVLCTLIQLLEAHTFPLVLVNALYIIYCSQAHHLYED